MGVNMFTLEMHKKYLEAQKEKKEFLKRKLNPSLISDVDKYTGCIPTALYKYYSFSPYSIEALTKTQLYFRNINKFNDPYDSRINFQVEGDKDLEKKRLVNVKHEIYDSTFASCFSENLDSMLMWSHYAKEHEGFCVIYDGHEIWKFSLEQRANNSIMFAPIIYENEFIKYNTKCTKHEHVEHIFSSIHTKSEDWIYEQEWRLSIIDKSLYGKDGFTLCFIKPKAIILGAKCKNEDKKVIMEFGKKNHISVLQMILDENSYHFIRTFLSCENFDAAMYIRFDKGII